MLKRILIAEPRQSRASTQQLLIILGLALRGSLRIARIITLRLLIIPIIIVFSIKALVRAKILIIKIVIFPIELLCRPQIRSQLQQIQHCLVLNLIILLQP